MLRIAILTCLRSNNNCTRAACLKAFNQKNAYFARYGQEELELVALWCCNGCKELDFHDEEGMEEKLQRIIDSKVDVLHIGVCCQTRASGQKKQKCLKVTAIAERLAQQGIKIIWGTHA